MQDPITPVAKYYKSLLKPGESLWWTGTKEEVAPPTVRLWSSLSANEKEELVIQGYTLFPEILTKGNNKKYNRYALWLVTQKGIVNTNIRDGFSAGGKVMLKTPSGIEVSMPAAFGRINKYSDLILKTLYSTDKDVLADCWDDDIQDNRIQQWCRKVALEADNDVGYSTAWKVLSVSFPMIDESNYSSFSMVAEDGNNYNK